MSKYTEKDCDFCNQTNACDPCNDSHCGCKYTFPAACVLYDGGDFCIIPSTQGDSIESIFESLDAFLCELNEQILLGIVIENIGGGAEVWKDKTLSGTYRFRTIVTGDDTLLDVVEQEETIEITAGTPSLDLDSETDILSLIVTTLQGATIFSQIDLSEYNYDTFVQDVTFDEGTQILTITRNNGEPDIDVDLSFLNNHLETASYTATTNVVTYTLTDGSTVDLDLSVLVNEILNEAADNQVQSDYLENNTSSAAHILNRNPSKTVTLGAGGNYNIVATDNNYIIEIDNGANDVTIDITALGLTTEFFVGFIQKGTGLVTFVGYDIKPDSLSDVLYGQGHIAAFEIINSTKYLHGTLKAA